MIIGVNGFGATGATACMDLLCEFENIEVVQDLEFELVHETDGLVELALNVLRRERLASSFAMERFLRSVSGPQCVKLRDRTNGKLESLAQDYIESITTVTWSGRSVFQPLDFYGIDANKLGFQICRILQKLASKKLQRNMYPKHTMRSTDINEEELIAKTKVFLIKTIRALQKTPSKNIVLEQLFSSSNPTEGFQFFDDPYSIVVDRDPRDIYIRANYNMPGNLAFMPHRSKNVDDFIAHWKAIRPLRNSESLDKRVLLLHFEDLIFYRERSIKKLEDFLGLKHSPTKTQHFFPSVSINNTCLYKKYPEAAQDIARIEEELAPYLYDFESCDYSKIKVRYQDPF